MTFPQTVSSFEIVGPIPQRLELVKCQECQFDRGLKMLHVHELQPVRLHLWTKISGSSSARQIFNERSMNHEFRLLVAATTG